MLYQKLLQTTPREAELLSRLEAMASALEVAQRENALLRQKLDLVLRRMFGSSSEKVSKDQLELLLNSASKANSCYVRGQGYFYYFLILSGFFHFIEFLGRIFL